LIELPAVGGERRGRARRPCLRRARTGAPGGTRALIFAVEEAQIRISSSALPLERLLELADSPAEA
jgi:hypothetical protein